MISDLTIRREVRSRKKIFIPDPLIILETDSEHKINYYPCENERKFEISDFNFKWRSINSILQQRFHVRRIFSPVINMEEKIEQFTLIGTKHNLTITNFVTCLEIPFEVQIKAFQSPYYNNEKFPICISFYYLLSFCINSFLLIC